MERYTQTGEEPNLDELMADPIVRLLRHSDGLPADWHVRADECETLCRAA